MALITNQRIALIDANNHGLLIEAYDSRLAMVKQVMDSGALGGGGCYGDEKHKSALDEIESHIVAVRESIEKHWAEKTAHKIKTT